MPLAITSLKIEADLKQRLQKLAESRRRSANWLMGEALREYVAREEAREQFDRDTIEAWEEFERTGKSVSGETADAWLAQLASGQDIDPPQDE